MHICCTALGEGVDSGIPRTPENHNDPKDTKTDASYGISRGVLR